MYKPYLVLLFFFILSTSCDYQLFVKKDNIYHRRTGYLIFFNNRKYFFPHKKITNNDFFNTNIKTTGYIIEFELDELSFSETAQKYVIDYEYDNNGTNIFVRDTMRIIPVTIASLPYEHKTKTGIDNWNIRYEGRVRRLKYSGTNNEAIQTVYPILPEDIKKFEHFYENKTDKLKGR